MKTAYFDCYNGISGDMFLGALIDAGLDFKKFKLVMSGLSVKGYNLEINKVARCGINATKFTVTIDHEHHAHRKLADINKIIEDSDLTESVKEKSKKVFKRLAEAEAAVHDATIDAVHFHEVGGIDAIIDIVGSVYAVEELGIERIYSSPLTEGTGTIMSAHGELPVPVPATVELLKGVPIRQIDVNGEMVTPTGAALITTLADAFGNPASFMIEKTGYGAGTRIYEKRTNFLRVMIGESGPDKLSDLISEEMIVISTEIDDMNPELFQPVMEKLFGVKCNDVHYTPIYMKKNRPAYKLEVLCSKALLETVSQIILNETSTFGFKVCEIARYCINRDFVKLETDFGIISFKRGFFEGEIIKMVPEFEDCKKVAKEKGVAVYEVYSNALKYCGIAYKKK